MYLPATARFLSADPLPLDANPVLLGTPNLYKYAQNDPLNRVDPSGEDPTDSDPDAVGATHIEFAGIDYYISDSLDAKINLNREARQAAFVMQVQGIEEDAKSVFLALVLQGAVYKRAQADWGRVLDKLENVGRDDDFGGTGGGGDPLKGWDFLNTIYEARQRYREISELLSDTKEEFNELRFNDLEMSVTVWGAGSPFHDGPRSGFDAAIRMASRRILTRDEVIKGDSIRSLDTDGDVMLFWLPIPYLGKVSKLLGRRIAGAALAAARRIAPPARRLAEKVFTAAIVGGGRLGAAAGNTTKFAFNSVRATTSSLLNTMGKAGTRGLEWLNKRFDPKNALFGHNEYVVAVAAKAAKVREGLEAFFKANAPKGATLNWVDNVPNGRNGMINTQTGEILLSKELLTPKYSHLADGVLLEELQHFHQLQARGWIGRTLTAKENALLETEVVERMRRSGFKIFDPRQP